MQWDGLVVLNQKSYDKIKDMSQSKYKHFTAIRGCNTNHHYVVPMQIEIYFIFLSIWLHGVMTGDIFWKECVGGWDKLGHVE